MKSYQKSLELLKKNKILIPDGKTFSGSTLFDQGLTPFAFKKGQGAKLWDVDDNVYTDFILSLGTIAIGHADKNINQAILRQLKDGVSYSLSHPLEIEVASKLIQMIPSAEMVRFGKNGSDVLSASVRLARYITSKDEIACCGYHGYQDWSIANSSRNGGIPNSIKKICQRFTFNDIDSLNKLIKNNDLSCVVMDCVARYYPKPGFLEDVRDLTQKNNIILIFDEVITGFRLAPGGAQEFFGVTPDLSCFGKAIANGMPLAALVGRAELMERNSELFYSLTAAGEALSLAACNEALKKYNQPEFSKNLNDKGKMLVNKLTLSIKEVGLSKIISIQGMNSRPIIYTNHSNAGKAVTKMAIKMAQRGFLYNSSIFICESHSMRDISEFCTAFAESLKDIKEDLI
jgi:glutamate-1-semialdehyde 2,1-aminomutase